MPRNRRPIEALSLIVSACPSDLHDNKSCSNGGSSPVPGASRNRLASDKKAHFVAGEYGGANLRVYGDGVGQKGRTSCV